MRTLFIIACLALSPGAAHGQFKTDVDGKGVTLGRETTQRIRVGAIIRATGLIQRVVVTAPVPTDWPEQRVRIVNEDVTSSVKGLTYRYITAGGGLKQMVVEIPQLLAGQEARALITFEVSRYALSGPADHNIYKAPKKLDRQMLLNIGAGPYIESRHPKIIAAAKEAVGDEENDWKKAEAIYEWVRQNVIYKQGELKGAVRALFDKAGDTDELTSLFIAMCRVHKIPARTVFVLGGVYAEFYLEDDDGKGHWFPCQPAGMPSFGSIDEQRPILQKGDNFKNPDKPKERQRYVTEYFTAAGRGGQPKVDFISEIVAE